MCSFKLSFRQVQATGRPSHEVPYGILYCQLPLTVKVSVYQHSFTGSGDVFVLCLHLCLHLFFGTEWFKVDLSQLFGIIIHVINVYQGSLGGLKQNEQKVVLVL